MMIAIICLSLIILILLVFIFLYIREIRHIDNQLKDMAEDDTNKLINSGISFSSTEKLCININKILKKSRLTEISFNKNKHKTEQMLTNISHDLRTPLTSAMGYINIIKDGKITEEEKNREIEIIAKRLVRIEELINSFFELTKIISSEHEISKTDVNIVGTLEESIAHYYDDFSVNEREVRFDASENRMILKSNNDMLIRIFDNLINNSLKHGIGTLNISTYKKDSKVYVIFSNKVTSTDFDIDQVFDEFYTKDISREKGNTGLGLAIAKEFSQMLGGEISAKLIEDNFEITIALQI